MKIKIGRQWLCLIALVTGLAACKKKPEDRLYEAFKCASAAAFLEHETEAARAGAEVEAELAGYVNSKERLRTAITELNARFQKEFPESEQMQDIYDSKACQAMYTPALLNLGDASPSASRQSSAGNGSDVGPELVESTREQAETLAALMKVAKLLATEHGGDPAAVAQFCEQNAKSFASQEQLQQCKALGGPAALVPTPKTAEEAFRIAATLPAKARFDFCTSEVARKLFVYNDDYERCFPPEAQAEAERLGGVNDQDQMPVQASPDAIREQIVANAAQMNARERQAYCYIPSVLEEFDNDPAECLNGRIIPTDQDPGYRDEGN